MNDAESMDWLIERVDQISKRGWRLDRRHIFQGSYDVLESAEQDQMYQRHKEQRLADAVAEGWLEISEDKYGKVYVMSQKSKDKLRDNE